MSSNEFDEDDPGMDLGEQVYHLKVGGLNIPEIASRLGLTKVRTARLYQDYIVELARYVDPGVRAAAVNLELERLDRLQNAYWHTATEPHDAMVKVGKGDDAFFDRIEVDPDKDAAKLVLEVMKVRHKVLGLDQLPATEQSVTQNILVVGENQQAFLDALAMGKAGTQSLTSGDPDNELEGVAIMDEEES